MSESQKDVKEVNLRTVLKGQEEITRWAWVRENLGHSGSEGPEEGCVE